MAVFVMPSLGADMEEGTVMRWLVSPGDSVHRGQIIVEINTRRCDTPAERERDLAESLAFAREHFAVVAS